MKKVIYLTLFLTSLNLTYSQNALYDAQALAMMDSVDVNRMIKKGKDINLSGYETKQLQNLLLFFAKPDTSAVKAIDTKSISSAVNKYNAYAETLKAFYDPADETFMGFRSAGALSSNVALIPNLLLGQSSISDTAQSNILDGLVKYYAEEFRKAQTITYLKAFEATAGKIGEIEILFPETFQKLKNADPSKFPDLGNEYKDIFSEDLKNAWGNLVDYIDNYPADTLPDGRLKLLKARNLSAIRNHKLYFPTKVSSGLLERLIKGQHPVEVLNWLDGEYYNPASTDTGSIEEKAKHWLGMAVHGLNLFQTNLRDTSQTNGRIWVSQEALRGLNTEKEFQYFFALLYQQDRDFFNKLLGNEVDSLKRNAQNIKVFINKEVRPLLDHLDRIQTLKKNIANADDKSKPFLDYLEAHVAILNDLKLLPDSVDFNTYFQLSGDLIDFYNSIRESDFSNVVYHVLKIASAMLEGSDIDFTEVIFKLEEYGGFMSEIINAENSDEVKETIKKFAAPASSYILKRSHSFTVSVTGQPGYFMSLEQLEGEKPWKFVSGLTLPMGFEFTVKKKSDLKNTQPSYGLFLQVIDLGAMLNFRLDSATSELPDLVTLDQVFSPGASFTYGLKNSPVTLGLGYQYTPELRKLNKGMPNESKPRGHQFFFRLGWDIPLINIYKSKKR